MDKVKVDILFGVIGYVSESCVYMSLEEEDGHQEPVCFPRREIEPYRVGSEFVSGLQVIIQTIDGVPFFNVISPKPLDVSKLTDPDFQNKVKERLKRMSD